MNWMRRSLLCKIVAFVLAAAALVALVFSGSGVIYNLDSGGYSIDEPTFVTGKINLHGYEIAHRVVQRYVQQTYGEADNPNLQKLIDRWWDTPELTPGTDYEYEVRTLEGKVVDSNRTDAPVVQTFDDVTSATYFKSIPYTAMDEMVDAYEETLAIPAAEEVDGWFLWEDYIDSNGRMMWAYGKESGRYYVKIFYLEPAVAAITRAMKESPEYWAFQYRNELLCILGGSAAVLLVLLIYLAWAVDHRRDTETLNAWGINRIPLDLSFMAYGTLGSILAMVEVEFVLQELFWREFGNPILWVLGLGIAMLGSMMILGWLLSLAAQLKQGGGFWWRNSICGRILLRCGKYLRRGWKYLWKNWELVPLMWHWLVSGVAILAALAFAMLVESGFLVVLVLAACAALIVYNGIGYGKLLQGVRRMSQGHLEEKVELGKYAGQYRVFAEDLNSMADAAMEAARKQTTSERMRTELITNVSHDIKTPLTSIVNYVDLLQKAHTPEEEQRYLEVLSRQSLRMKKLVEDLVEMSKATTGNLPVELTWLDAVEALHQSLGEFAERLEKLPLEVVLQVPKEPVLVRADGRLVWRVLSNLLGNVVKYAMPGTRFYVTLKQIDGQVLISLKNISREPLNISAEELMERFVRGDASRNTEGSGLGLNIAQSLVEVQHGSLELVVDGDLFKADIRLPGEPS